MAPTLREGDRVVVDFNVVVYKSRRPGLDSSLLIKRVVAVAGDTVEGTDKGVLVNGGFTSEP
jgi:signal peptidase I